MAFSVDQTSTIGQSSGNTVTCTFNTLPAAGSFIVATYWYNAVRSTTLTDDQGNAYLTAESASHSPNVSAYCAYTPYKLKLPGSGTLTLTASIVSGTFWGMQARSYTSSTAGTVLADTAAVNTTSGINSSFQYNSGTPIGANELFVTAFGTNSGGSNEGVSVGSGSSAGFAIVNTAVNNGSIFEVGAMADLIATDSSFKTINWTWSAGDSPEYASIIVPFYVQPFSPFNQHVLSQAVSRGANR